MRFPALLAALAAAAAEVVLDRSQPGMDLLSPQVFESENGALAVTLRVGVVTLKMPTATFKTRLYNGQLPGPTLLVRPGDVVTVTLINDLEDIDNDENFNNLQRPNSTNMHFHGLHESPNAPGDDVFVEVKPGQSRTYTYRIDASHMGGHHWYHPHQHGSTGLQVGGGMFGSLIVQDSKGEVPKSLMNTETTVLDILSLPFKGQSADLKIQQDRFNKALLQPEPPITGTIITTVNGGVAPRISLRKNEWRRFRILYASTWFNLFTMVAGSEPGAAGGACEWRLLAKDGVYVAEAPRPFGLLPLTPAARVDILLRCTQVGDFDWYAPDVDSEVFGDSSDKLAAVFGGEPTSVTPWDKWYDDMARKRVYAATVATLVVSDSDAEATEPVQFKPKRPCYAVDLQEAAVSRSELLNFSMTSVWMYESPKLINNQKMPKDHGQHHLFEFDVGTVVQLELQGANMHPIHIHVNAQQLVGSGPGLKGNHDDAFGGYMQLGDWHDTVYSYAKRTLVRLQLDKYTGPMTLHCHVLRHEDEGMMNTIAIQGDEGTTWPGAELIDPTCWREGGERGFDACFDGSNWNIALQPEEDCEWVSQNPSVRCDAVSATGISASAVCQKTCDSCVADVGKKKVKARDYVPALYSLGLLIVGFFAYLTYTLSPAKKRSPQSRDLSRQLVSQNEDEEL